MVLNLRSGSGINGLLKWQEPKMIGDAVAQNRKLTFMTASNFAGIVPRYLKPGFVSTLLLLCLGAVSVKADSTSVTFSFNSLSANETAGQIATYMDGVLAAAGCTGCTVTVTGAVADQTWNADGNVVGPSAQSLTLGNSNGATSNSSNTPGATDTFIANTSDSGTPIASQITMQFSGFTINGAASFDYQIFPDITCPVLNSSNCGGSPNGSGIYPNQPDLSFEAGSSSTVSAVTSFGTNGTQYGVTPSASNAGGDGTSTHSPLSGSLSIEKAPQYIGTWSTTSALNGDTQLDFVDWPATIGVDNLTISWTTPSPVPEPGSIILVGTALAGLALNRRRKTRKV